MSRGWIILISFIGLIVLGTCSEPEQIVPTPTPTPTPIPTVTPTPRPTITPIPKQETIYDEECRKRVGQQRAEENILEFLVRVNECVVATLIRQTPTPRLTVRPTWTPTVSAFDKVISGALCEYFLEVMVDFKDGLLTTAETQQKTREIYERAQFGEDAQLQQLSRNLLREAVALNGSGYVRTATEMLNACKKYLN